MFDKLSQENKDGDLGSIAGQALQRYKALYAIEARIKYLIPDAGGKTMRSPG